MVVRTARNDDAAAIARVQVASWHAVYRGLMPDERLDAFTVAAREPAWRRNLAAVTPGRRTSVFERGGEVLGFVTAGPSREAPPAGEIWALYVIPSAWGTGVGSALMADAVGFLTARGHRRMVIWVLDGNTRALAFYAASGFALDGGRLVRDGLTEVRVSRIVR